MEHTHSGASPSLSENHDRSQFTDLTDNSTSGKENHVYVNVHAIKPQGSKGWYARMYDEKKAEYLLKRRQTRAEKKAANASCQQVSQHHSSSCLSRQCTPFTNITNTGTAASSGSSDHQPAVTNVACKKQGWYAGLSEEKKAQHLQKLRLARLEKKVAAKSVTANVPQSHTPLLSTDGNIGCKKQSGRGWYGSLSQDKKAEHLMKLRMARQEKKIAAEGVNVHVTPSPAPQVSTALSYDRHQPNMPCRGSVTDDDDDNYWMHTDMTYQRGTMHVQDVYDVQPRERFMPQSYVSGPSSEMIAASSERKRRRMREQYANMPDHDKEAVLCRNRAYKIGRRRTTPLSEQSYIADVAGGSKSHSPTTPSIPPKPYGYSSTDVIHIAEEPDEAGIFEPIQPSAEMEGFFDDMQEDEILDDDDEECRIFSTEGHEFESYRLPTVVDSGIHNDDPYDNVYRKLPTSHHVLKTAIDCDHCGAMRFQYEGPAFCCRKGKVKIFIPDVPQELQRLFTSPNDEDAKYFRHHIRYFNSHFSFTSLGVTLDHQVSSAARTGVYTFRAHGQLYHRLDHLVPAGQGPRHLQLYIFDTDDTLEHRVKRSPDLDINLIRKILRILDKNPYVDIFKSIGSVPNLAEYRISLNTDIKLDQRRYNAPTTSQVAAMWVEGSDPQNTFDRSVIVYGKGGRPVYIRAYYACYDPLAYPLFFPGGETGWNRFNEESVNKLIEDVFPSLHENAACGAYMSTRAILSTKNDHVDELNGKMIDRFPGQEKVYYSFDSVEDDAHNNYPIDYLNSITPNGLPPHVLKIKVNCPVILLRNLDPHNGLCNGTRLMIRAFQNNAIDAEIVGGQHAGKRVFIPRIPLAPSDDISLPFKLKRKQFPLRLSFAMTINKAQGQTLPTVGIYLPEPVFSHGQLYVALSRGVSRQTTRILAKPNKDVDPTGKSTKNIVYRDVLEG